MNQKKLLSIFTAATIASFSIPAVCASAADDCTSISDWTLIAEYTEDFDNLDSETAVQTLSDRGWNFSRNATDAITVRPDTNDNAISIHWNRSATYQKADNEVAYYYKYKVRAYDNNCAINLIGHDNNFLLVGGETINGSSYEFTTLIVPEKNAAYTYDKNNHLINTTPIENSETVEGIKFCRNINDDNASLHLYNFEYGKAQLNDAPNPEETVTKAYTFVQSLNDVMDKKLTVTITPENGDQQSQERNISDLISTHFEGEGDLSLAVILTGIPISAEVNSVVID